MAKVQAFTGRHLPHGLTFLLLRRVILPTMREPGRTAGAADPPRKRPR
jgi:hypothetical protein